MASFCFDIVGFDLDGTLLDTRVAIAGALNHALAHGGHVPLAVEEVVPMIGGGVRRLLEQALGRTGEASAGEVDRLLPVLLDHYRDHSVDGAVAYPGMAETLDALADAGVRLGVVTNKPQEITEVTLDRLGLADRFGCVLGGDAAGIARGKPAPDALIAMRERLGGGRAAFVGDMRYDVLAARAAAMPVVACRFGFAPHEVDGLGADAVIDRFADLLPALAAL